MFINSDRQVTGKVPHFLDKDSFTDNIIYWTSKTQNDLISPHVMTGQMYLDMMTNYELKPIQMNIMYGYLL